MTNAINDIKKSKKGRPRTETAPVMVRLPEDMIVLLDDYRRALPNLPSRPETIRQILKAYFEK